MGAGNPVHGSLLGNGRNLSPLVVVPEGRSSLHHHNYLRDLTIALGIYLRSLERAVAKNRLSGLQSMPFAQLGRSGVAKLMLMPFTS